MESAFEKLDVLDVVSGFVGGQEENPTYDDYAKKGYVEAVQITYDPKKISYEKLLDTFWHNIDPTDAEGQFGDRGKQYASAIFYHNDNQKKLAEESKKKLEESGIFDKKIITPIKRVSKFYKAADYHQNYYKKNPLRYKTYRYLSGRDKFLNSKWKNNKFRFFDVEQKTKYVKASKEELHKRLTKIQYDVTQNNATEKPFVNEYWNNKKAGIYVDIVSGEPLFSSIDKFQSGTGWPSFTKPIDTQNIIIKKDNSLFGFFNPKMEVRSKKADSHLGHIFNDGPPPTKKRYCINSAALRFIPVEDLEKENYGKYKQLFLKKSHSQK